VYTYVYIYIYVVVVVYRVKSHFGELSINRRSPLVKLVASKVPFDPSPSKISRQGMNFLHRRQAVTGDKWGSYGHPFA
jgi:hypothetical protein